MANAPGINGFVPKGDWPALLLHALWTVRAGGVYIPARTLGDFQNGQAPATIDSSGLTPRQLDVLRGPARTLCPSADAGVHGCLLSLKDASTSVPR